jgi:hypothetical protein
MKSKTCKQNSDTRFNKEKADKQIREYSDFRFRSFTRIRDVKHYQDAKTKKEFTSQIFRTF